MMEATLEKQGDGRYDVHYAGSRIGLVLGGSKTWAAELNDGTSLGTFASRQSAVDAVVSDATHSVWLSMQRTATDYALPKHYTSDLALDRQTLRQWRGITDFMWVLRENGTQFVPIDMEWSRREANAVLLAFENAIRGGQAHVFHVRARSGDGDHDNRVRHMTLAQAKALLDRPSRYRLDLQSRAILLRTDASSFAIADLDMSQASKHISASGQGIVTVNCREGAFSNDTPAFISAAFAYMHHYIGSPLAKPDAIRVVRAGKVIDQWASSRSAARMAA
jgi:hypothetical protein